MYLSGKLLFKTSHKTLKFQENPRKMHFPVIYRPKFKKTVPVVSIMGPPHGAIELNGVIHKSILSKIVDHK